MDTRAERSIYVMLPVQNESGFLTKSPFTNAQSYFSHSLTID